MNNIDTAIQTDSGLDLGPVFEALEHPLALIDDERRRDEARLLFEASRLHQERAIIDLLSEVIAKVNESASDIRIRLEYGSRRFHIAVDSVNGSEEPSDPMVRMDGDLEKVTIRLPKLLKESIDEAVAEQGVSLNSWYVRSLARSVFHQSRRRRSEGPDGERPHGRYGGRGRRRGGPFREDPA